MQGKFPNIDSMIFYKFIFTYIFCLLTVLSFSQDWNINSGLDTIRDKKGQILTIVNFEKGETLYFLYYRDGKIKSVTFTTRKNKVQYDKITEYSSTGGVEKQYFVYVISKIFYGKPILDSTYVEYYDNGKVANEMEYKKGRLINVKSFDKEGKSLYTGNFSEGNGDLINYYEGIQIDICKYKNGRMVKRSCHCN